MSVSIPDKFEYKCVRPGHWRVEGYDIEQRGGSENPGKPVRWQVTRAGNSEEFLGWRSTLQKAIDEIVCPAVEGYVAQTVPDTRLAVCGKTIDKKAPGKRYVYDRRTCQNKTTDPSGRCHLHRGRL